MGGEGRTSIRTRQDKGSVSLSRAVSPVSGPESIRESQSEREGPVHNGTRLSLALGFDTLASGLSPSRWWSASVSFPLMFEFPTMTVSPFFTLIVVSRILMRRHRGFRDTGNWGLCFSGGGDNPPTGGFPPTFRTNGKYVYREGRDRMTPASFHRRGPWIPFDPGSLAFSLTQRKGNTFFLQ